jgi:hypothetical protein
VGNTRRVVAVTIAVILIALTACSRSKTESTTNTSASTGSTASGGGAPGNGQFGTLTDPVCGKAPAGQTNTASAPGVTADSISIGTISDTGYVGAPGLNQELFDASKAFSDWCNSLGGINGRTIKMNQRDAAIFDYKARILDACASDFALVGGGGVSDGDGQDDRMKCLLPEFPGYSVTPRARGAALQVSALPFPLGAINFGLARYLSEQFPDSVDKVGYLTGNVGSIITNKQQYQEAGTALGFKTVYDEQYNAVGEATWVPFAQAIKDKGVRGLFYVGEPTNLGKLLAALDQIGYKLDWVGGAGNIYDQSLIDSAGAGLSTNTVYTQTAVTPFLAADKVPAVKQYQELLKKYVPSAKPEAALGLNSFTAWLLWAQSAKACGADLTRKCLLEKGSSTTTWDGGGLSALANPSQTTQPPACISFQKATADGFSLINWQSEDGVYNCNPANVVDLKADYGKPAALADVGKTEADVK